MAKVLKRDTAIRRRSYSYEIGGTTLNFQLRTDIKEEMKNFLEILKAATEDVSEELKRL